MQLCLTEALSAIVAQWRSNVPPTGALVHSVVSKQVSSHLHDIFMNLHARVRLSIHLHEERATADIAKATDYAGMLGIAKTKWGYAVFAHTHLRTHVHKYTHTNTRIHMHAQ